jgi:hypothetical protein
MNAGVAVEWTRNFSTYISYDGQLGRDRYDSNGLFERIADQLLADRSVGPHSPLPTEVVVHCFPAGRFA